MNRAFLILAVGLIPLTCLAESTICKIEDNLELTAVTWNNETLVAKITDGTGDGLTGKVTSIREHDDGYKINIFVSFDEPYYGSDAHEYVLFYVNGDYRVMGVTYVEINGERLVNPTFGNSTLATCVSI